MLRRLGFCTAVVLVAALSSPASALDTGQCLPAAQVRATLAAEGQNTIIVGNRTGYGYPTALIFTSDASGSKGYALRGDKPLGEQATTICVDSVYRDVRLNDITRPGIPAWAKMGGDAAKAAAICKRDRLGYQEDCRANDLNLTNLESNGRRVMLVATGAAINPRDKSVRQGQRLVVTLAVQCSKGLFLHQRRKAQAMFSLHTRLRATPSMG